MRKALFLLSGIPGSGKTTFVNELKKDGVSLNHISRDKIRFSLLEESDSYFQQENLVFDLFCEKIQESLNAQDEKITIADATHLNEKARNKVLDRLDLNNTDVYIVIFDIPLEICLERNALREGRALVPESVIKNMYKSFTHASEDEKYNYKQILYVCK